MNATDSSACRSAGVRILPARVLTIAGKVIDTAIAWHDATLWLGSRVFHVQENVNTGYKCLRE